MSLISLLEKHADLWIVCAICLLLRIVLECEGSYELQYIAKEILKRIGILFILIIAWSTIYETVPNDNIVFGLFIGTYIYIYTILVEKCERTGGYTSSFLLILNCLFITFMSFMPLLGTIIGSLCIIGISILIYKHWDEKKCDLAENLALCLETIIVSVILLITKLESSIYYTLLFLVFEESVLDVLNKGIRYLVKLTYNKQDED